MDYYLNNHLPMVGKLFTETKSSEIEKGHSGPMPGSESAYMAAASLYFDKVEDFTSVFAANAETIAADFPNYTNVEPIIQISEVLG